MSIEVLPTNCTSLGAWMWLNQSLFLIVIYRSFFHKPGWCESVELQSLIMICVKIMHPLLLLSCLPDKLISSFTVRNNESPFPVYLHRIIHDFMYHCYIPEPSIPCADVLVIQFVFQTSYYLGSNFLSVMKWASWRWGMASTGQTQSFLQVPHVILHESKSNGMGFAQSPKILCAPGTAGKMAKRRHNHRPHS